MWTLIMAASIVAAGTVAQGPAKHEACAKMTKEAEAKAAAARAAAGMPSPPKLKLLRPESPTPSQRVMPGAF